MRNWIIAIVLLISTLPAGATYADTIKLAADFWMPYNGDGKTETGYMLDVAKKVFGDAGNTVVFETAPWARAIDSARKGLYNGIIGATVADAPDFIFPKSELAIVNTEFFVKKGNTWRYNGIQSLGKIKLSIIKDYAYNPDLDQYIADNQASKDRLDIGFGDNVLETNFQKLINGRVDAVVDGGAVLRYTANKMGIQGQVVSAGIGDPGSLTYIAFSPALGTSKKYTQILSDGIDRLRKSGELKTILAKYGLTDWK
jgi:polar amino acid transport system substrate-binding protein